VTFAANPAGNRSTDLVERARRRLAAEATVPTADGLVAAVRAEAGLAAGSDVLAALRTLQAELAGFGPLQPLLDDPELTDVLVNASDEVWIDRGRGLEAAGVAFADEQAVRRLAQRLAAHAGRRLDDAAPYVDARLADGTRLHAVLPPVASDGTALSLRMSRRRAFTVAELLDADTLVPASAALLRAIISARLAFLVTGGTGSGKTTLLAALLSLVDPGDRMLLVEDSGELRPDHPHVVRLEARAPNVEGRGAVPLSVLVRQSLRMRPDRIVVGEVRGAEVVDLLAALNTGHDGGCGTLHANRAADVPARLEALAVAAGLGREALHSQVAAALHLVVHLIRGADGRRRVAEICLLERGADGLVRAEPAATFDADGAHSARAWPAMTALLAARGAPVTTGRPR
jgi:pilus assembly protein CpaF